MKPASIIKKLPGKPEIIVDRQLDSKTFYTGRLKRRLVKVFGPIHYRENLNDRNENWKEIDLTPIDAGNNFIVTKAPYKITVDKKRIAFNYISKQGGSARFSLVKVGSIDFVEFSGEPRVEENRIWWDDVAPDTSIYLELRPAKVEFFKVLKSETAVREFTWNIEHDIENEFRIKRITSGHDAERRKIRLSHQILNEKVTGQKRSFQLCEKFEGQTAVRVSKKIRKLEWKDIVSYPVTIDADITENITVANDDGNEDPYPPPTVWDSHWDYGANYWIAGMGYGGTQAYHGGLRFQTIVIPQGATIDLANLKIQVVGIAGSPTTQIYGDDVDDAPAWANDSKPTTATKTTAKTAFAPVGTGWKTKDVTAIVQEIVDRGGWVSGQDMRFVIWNTGAPAENYFQAYDYGKGQADAAILEIDFTVGGLAGVKTINGVAIASVKSINGVAIASVKSINGVV